MLLGNMQAGMLPGEEQGNSQERKERTWMFQEKKTFPRKGRKNMDALGTEGWDGCKEGTGTLCGPRPLQLHPAAAQEQSTAPQFWPLEAFPSPATGPGFWPIPLPALLT